MKEKYSISVIIGIYNCAETLQEALDSIYAQTFQDFEIILCDDGSKDNTYAIALENAKKHNNIVLLKNEENLGLNATLNNCLAVASGKYIARMDGDDISTPDRFEKEYKFLEAHPEYAIVSCNMIFFDENGEFGRGKKKGGEVTKNDILPGPPFCHAPCMVRKEAYMSVGGYTVDERLLRMEDCNLWYKMYLNGYKGYNLPDYLYQMRDDRNATSRRKLKYRINEFYFISSAIKGLNLPKRYYLYLARTVIITLLPKALYTVLHKAKLR